MPLRQAVWGTVLEAFYGLLTMVIILGGILSGVFTAELAAVACVYAFLVTRIVYRDYRSAGSCRSWCTGWSRPCPWS